MPAAIWLVNSNGHDQNIDGDWAAQEIHWPCNKIGIFSFRTSLKVHRDNTSSQTTCQSEYSGDDPAEKVLKFFSCIISRASNTIGWLKINTKEFVHAKIK